jgi:hypothetical protein
MNQNELHEFLTGSLSLVPEPVANQVARTYFYQRVEWHPRHSTRVFRVIFGANGQISRIQLCATSDNNNTALISPPFDARQLTLLANIEIAKLNERLATAG